jgi:hypothetical protein
MTARHFTLRRRLPWIVVGSVVGTICLSRQFREFSAKPISIGYMQLQAVFQQAQHSRGVFAIATLFLHLLDGSSLRGNALLDVADEHLCLR